MRSPLHLSGAFVGAVLLLAVGCGEDPQGPTPDGTAVDPGPALATAALTFRQITAGSGWACGVVTGADSSAYCWGYNLNGQLGDNTTTSRPKPGLVRGQLRWRTVMAGTTHSCGVAGDGKAYCWGSNMLGQLGANVSTSAPQRTPVQVGGGHKFRSVTVGEFHSCGVATDDRAYCWGWNHYGQLGDGTITDIIQLDPVLVAGGVRFRSLTAGLKHTCGIGTDDRAYCWGDNRQGQLGDSVGFTSRGTPFRVAGGRFYKWLEAGNSFTCGVTTAGKAFCWGYGRGGELGNGKTNLSFWPRAVSGGIVFRNIAAGADHTCGVATDGQEWCWGRNSQGQFGDGTTTSRLVPAKSVTGVAIAKMAAGEQLTCGLTGAGKAWCWGSNGAGQVGDGTTITPRLTPRAVVGP